MLGTTMPSTTSLGSSPSFHMQRRLEISLFPRQDKNLEPGVTLLALSGKNFVWVAAGELSGRVSARQLSGGGCELGTRRVPGSWGNWS